MLKGVVIDGHDGKKKDISKEIVEIIPVDSQVKYLEINTSNNVC